MERSTTALRKLLAGSDLIQAPGVADAMNARVVAKEGFKAIYMTGSGTSASLLGMPDIGLLTMSEMVDNAARIAEAAGLPLIADADTGYGNPINVRRTVRAYERAEVAAIHLEDVQQGIPDYELHVAANSGDMHNDRWLSRADGSRFWGSGTTTGLKDDAGHLIGFAKILRDTSDVKEQMERLRSRITEAEAADEHKTFFLAKLSHELRNPLAPLTNALHLLNAQSLSESLQYPVKLIERQVEVIRHLVDELLDVARIRTGKLQLETHQIDIRDIVRRAVESVQALAESRNQTIVQHLLGSPLMVNADDVRLEQAFVNLLTNAIKYTPAGGNIEIRASADQSEVCVRFIDNGIGIPSTILPHVFDLFTRGEVACAQAKDGLGIGLALVKEFVELHGGSVQVRSDGPGKGSEFTVRLPLARLKRLELKAQVEGGIKQVATVHAISEAGGQTGPTTS